jgi:hypothetical protein
VFGNTLHILRHRLSRKSVSSPVTFHVSNAS